MEVADEGIGQEHDELCTAVKCERARSRDAQMERERRDL